MGRPASHEPAPKSADSAIKIAKRWKFRLDLLELFARAAATQVKARRPPGQPTG
ncbi:hypothetical protein ACFPJ1_40985 [Kribbella qitaiheensis]|uniref:hypothetical protein n=1 Tax=Kribbella qitaiheensis TaxID=1544730 RepID=UPI00361CF99C